MSDAILTLNAGSSSLKFALYLGEGSNPARIVRGKAEGIGDAPHLVVSDAGGRVLEQQDWPTDSAANHEDVLAAVLAWVEDHLGADRVRAVGHRVVHGGVRFNRPVIITDDILAGLDALSPLAPLHQPHNLAAVRAVRSIRPQLPQVACFDTAFHHGHADLVSRFALPRAWHEQGVRRYGFHGLSYAFVSGALAQLDPALAAGRVIIAHLGAGASLCALQDGRSIDTTMGFTALDGLMMATRCGALDPGVVLYLQQQAGLSAEAVQDLLYQQSGLLGVSGLSGDMRSLLESPSPAARDAIDLFTFRIARETGALMSSIGGLDGFVFTGGIGENAAPIRARVAERLQWTGFELDPAANAAGAGCISTPSSSVRAWVIPTDEEAVIARDTARLVATDGGGG